LSAEIITSIIGFGKFIYEEIKQRIERQHLKGKYVILSMRDGSPITGKLIDHVKIGNEWGLKLETFQNKEVVILVKNISFIEFYSEEPRVELRHFYGIPPTRYSLSDFPEPFISKEGLDVVFVYGTSPLDYDDYKKYVEQKGERVELRTAFQRMGDFDLLLTLSSKFGFEIARSGEKIKKFVCYGRQDFTLTETEKKEHNLILVGSGYCNKIVKEILEYYPNLPIKFETPASHQAIIYAKDSSNIEVYDRTLTGRDVGIVALLPNPFNPNKVILIAAGLRTTGTQAALLLLCHAFERRICSITENVPEILVKATKIENVLGKLVVKECEIIRHIKIGEEE